MQPYFHWINEPAEWRRDADGLTVVTNKHTDFWRHTWYGFERFSGHLYAAEVAGDFTLQAKICADFTTLYDQAGLMMMADEQTWLKAGIEFNDDAPAIGSVLTLTHSDWATGLFPGDPRTFWLRLTRKGDALRLQYSTDGEHWPLLRLGYFPPGPVKAGVMCCSPERGGLAVAVSGYSAFPAAGQSAARSELNASGKTRLSLHPGAQDCRVRWCQGDKNDRAYRDRCRQGTLPDPRNYRYRRRSNRCRRRRQRSPTARYGHREHHAQHWPKTPPARIYRL